MVISFWTFGDFCSFNIRDDKCSTGWPKLKKGNNNCTLKLNDFICIYRFSNNIVECKITIIAKTITAEEPYGLKKRQIKTD